MVADTMARDDCSFQSINDNWEFPIDVQLELHPEISERGNTNSKRFTTNSDYYQQFH